MIAREQLPFFPNPSPLKPCGGMCGVYVVLQGLHHIDMGTGNIAIGTYERLPARCTLIRAEPS
jgi:hypothetical protein